MIFKYIYIYTHTHAGFNLRSSWSAQFSQRAVIKTLAMVGFLASLLNRTVFRRSEKSTQDLAWHIYYYLVSYRTTCAALIRYNRPLHGFRRHLGCGAVAAKITANVWKILQLSTLITPQLHVQF